MIDHVLEEFAEAAECYMRARAFAKELDVLIQSKKDFSPREVSAGIALLMAAWCHGQKDPEKISTQWTLLMQTFLRDMQQSKSKMAQF